MTRKRFRRVLTALTVVNRALARGKLGLGMGSGENSFISAIIRAIPVLLALCNIGKGRGGRHLIGRNGREIWYHVLY